MPTLTVVGIIVLALLVAAALFLMYEIGKLVGQQAAEDKFPEAKKAAVQRSRSVLSGSMRGFAAREYEGEGRNYDDPGAGH